jgi:hypothetical protein
MRYLRQQMKASGFFWKNPSGLLCTYLQPVSPILSLSTDFLDRNFDIKLDKARSSNTEEGILLSFVASRSKAVVGLVIVVVVANCEDLWNCSDPNNVLPCYSKGW